MTTSARSPLRVAIIGSGNIGTDLMMKVDRSAQLELVGIAGIDPESSGLRKARERGHVATHNGLAELLELVEDIDLAFDATSASAHAEHARLLPQEPQPDGPAGTTDRTAWLDRQQRVCGDVQTRGMGQPLRSITSVPLHV